LLLSTLRAGRAAHAYLVTGQEQVGRKTLALDFAKALNCLGAGGLDGAAGAAKPCGHCRQCTRIARGVHADVRVITVETQTRAEMGKQARDDDGEARHKLIRIEHIRDLEHDAALKPFEGACRVFVIDGAELMSHETANALLKTLEEPQPDVYLLLIAPSVDAVLPTVVSRCHVISLRPVPTAVIARELIERRQAAPDLADTLSRLAKGSPGWAINALNDPTLLGSHTQAVQRVVTAMTGGTEERFRYARDLAGVFWRKRDETLRELDVWSDWWRDVALAQNGLDDAVTNREWLPSIRATAVALDGSAALAAAEAVSAARRALQVNASPRLALEVLMLDLPRVDAGALPERAVVAHAAAPEAEEQG
jgi:DNA polymerase-3 subunit delta'